jgi:thioredoxin reductase
MTEHEQTTVQAPERIAIFGAGPVGLDAALAAADAGWPFTVFDAAPQVGGNVRRWGHVRLFSPWSMNVSERMAAHLAAAGERQPGPDDYCPTGAELISDLLEPLARLPELAAHIAYRTRVVGVGRQGLLKHEEIGSQDRAGRPFRIVVEGQDGRTAMRTASMVIDCTGTYATANATGDAGIPAPGEAELGDRIVRWMPDLSSEGDGWAGQTILLVGAGKSAQTAARDIAAWLPSAPGTRVIWAVRSHRPDWGEVADDPLPGRQALADAAKDLDGGLVPGMTVITGVVVDAFERAGERVAVRLRGGEESRVLVDRILSLTGYVPDTTLYRQLQVHECYATGAPMGLSAQLLGDAAGNCLEQTSSGVGVLVNPEPNFFILGSKSYGRNSQFLMRMGYHQISDVAGAYQPARTPVG